LAEARGVAAVRRGRATRYDNERDRRLDGNEQERLFRSARREDLFRSRDIAMEGLLIEAGMKAQGARNASRRQRFLKRARHQALKQLRRDESLIAFFAGNGCAAR
jgi:hypothetical protein